MGSCERVALDILSNSACMSVDGAVASSASVSRLTRSLKETRLFWSSLEAIPTVTSGRPVSSFHVSEPVAQWVGALLLTQDCQSRAGPGGFG
mgnify:CR=1 FL=1